MRSWKGLFIAIFVFGLAALNASAQSSHHEFEITPFGGTRFGGTIAFNPPATYTATGSDSSTQVDYMTIKSSFDYGLDADYSIWPGFQLEFMWNRQPTELGAHDAVNGGIIDVGPAKLDMYHFGPLWELRGEEAKLKPFIVFGVGFTHFGTNGILPGISNRFSYSVGGGVKYEANSHVGFRAEARYSPTHTTQQSGDEEDYFGDVYPVTVTNHANQGQANVGVIFRF